MTRQEAIRVLEEQLEKLKEADVLKIVKSGRVKEVVEKLQLDFYWIKYLYKGEAIYQSSEEIPKDYMYELIFYVKLSGLEDFIYFRDYEENCINVLLELEEEVAENIAYLMRSGDICTYSLEQLFNV